MCMVANNQCTHILRGLQGLQEGTSPSKACSSHSPRSRRASGAGSPSTRMSSCAGSSSTTRGTMRGGAPPCTPRA